MSESIPEWLAENYRTLAADRGTTVDKIADEYDEHSPALAAWMRSQAAESAPETRTAAPKNRRAAEKSKG
jgi:transposase-like protein